MMNFLKPTKRKVIGTMVVLLSLLLASFINEAITNKLIPEELLTADLEEAIADLMNNSDVSAYLGIGLKVLVLNIAINITAVYLSICFILREKGKV